MISTAITPTPFGLKRDRRRTRLRSQQPNGTTLYQAVNKKPSIKRLLLSKLLAGNCGFTDLVAELNRHPYIQTLPTPIDSEFTHIDIWEYIRIQPPPRPYAHPPAFHRIRAHTGKAGGLPVHDPIIYVRDPTLSAGLASLKGTSSHYLLNALLSDTSRWVDCLVGQLCLLFRLSPSVATSRKPPLMAYIRRFGKIPHQPSQPTGMYIVKKETRANGQPFGRVIMASQILRISPLAPVIEGVANRSVNANTSLSFYDSFFINKYHSHEEFDLLHVLK